MATEADIEALVADWEPKTRAAFISAVKDIRDGASLVRLGAAIEAGDVEGAMREIGMEESRFGPLDAVLAAIFAVGGASALIKINAVRQRGAPVVFDLRTYTANAWIREHSGRLISDVANDQKAMIRETIEAGVYGRESARSIVLDLLGQRSTVTGRREAALIGLSRVQVQWARNYEIELTGVPSKNALDRSLRDPRFDRAVSEAIRTETPLPAKTKAAMVNAYRNRALRQRAAQIGEMETLTALHQSQIEAAHQAIAAGIIDGSQVRRFWQTMQDDRVRKSHRPIPGLNRNGVGLDTPFITPDGPALYPPFGPGCRCRVRLRIARAVERIAA
jgi:hypothetical protein